MMRHGPVVPLSAPVTPDTVHCMILANMSNTVSGSLFFPHHCRKTPSRIGQCFGVVARIVRLDSKL